jgi:hypothetical protein
MTRVRNLLLIALACALAVPAFADTGYDTIRHKRFGDVTITGTLTTSGAIASSGTITTDAVAGATATTLAIGNATATAASLCNSAACDTITVGTNTDADAITIGDSNDTTAIASALWSVTGPGVGSFSSLVTNTITGASATTLTVGDTISTAVSVGNSAACDTVSIGTNADADAVNIGDASDTVAVTSALWSVTGPGVATFAHVRQTIAAAATAAAVDLTPALFRASGVFLADTTANAVDFEVDGALAAADLGTVKHFIVTVGGTNAITFSADGAGVTAVTTIQQGAGASCEDVGDTIRVTVTGTGSAIAETMCAD